MELILETIWQYLLIVIALMVIAVLCTKNRVIRDIMEHCLQEKQNNNGYRWSFWQNCAYTCNDYCATDSFKAADRFVYARCNHRPEFS